MKVSRCNTSINLKIKKTNNNEGLSNNDVWCLVEIIVDNKNFHYEIERESLTKNEIINGINIIKNYYYHNQNHEELIFIKNYIKIKFSEIENNNKELELKLISLVNNKYKTYSIYFKNDEIKDFIDLVDKNNIN